MVVIGVFSIVVTGVAGFGTSGDAMGAGVASGRGGGVGVDKEDFDVPKRLAARIY